MTVIATFKKATSERIAKAVEATTRTINVKAREAKTIAAKPARVVIELPQAVAESLYRFVSGDAIGSTGYDNLDAVEGALKTALKK